MHIRDMRTTRQILQGIEEMQKRILRNQAALWYELRAFRREDKEGDEIMSAETQAAINELKAEVAPMTDAVAALTAVVDGLVAQMEAAGDDPEEIREVIASFKSNRDAIVAATLKGTPISPSGN